MIRLAKLTDYAIVLLAEMARRQQGSAAARASAALLAARTGLPEPTVAKLLKALTRAGLVQATRGIAGGYALAGTPQSISVARIIAAIEGPVALTACVEGGEGGCTVQHRCATSSHWSRVNQAVLGALEAVSLAEMAAPPAWSLPQAAISPVLEGPRA